MPMLGGYGWFNPGMRGRGAGFRAAASVNQRAGLHLLGQRQLRRGLRELALSRSLTSQGATAQLVARNKVAQGVLGQMRASRADVQGALPNPRSAALHSIARQRISQGLAAQEIARKLVNRGRGFQLRAQKTLTQAFMTHAAAARPFRSNMAGSGRLLYAKAAGLF
jgi:hypothetical protein